MACETKEQYAEQEGVHSHHSPSTEGFVEKNLAAPSVHF